MQKYGWFKVRHPDYVLKTVERIKYLESGSKTVSKTLLIEG